MSITDNVSSILSRCFNAITLRHIPAQIDEWFPSDHPLGGQPAGRFLLRRDADGRIYHHFEATRREVVKPQAPATNERCEHTFVDLDSFRRWLDGVPAASVFVHGAPFDAHQAIGIHEQQPEIGAVTLSFSRHPAWARWHKVLGNGSSHVDLSHNDLGDLLIDNAEDVDDKAVVSQVRCLRAATTLNYDGDLDTGLSVGVSFTLKSGRREAQELEAKLPREFTARFPAFVGAWPPGEEPRHTARLRLRVMPPKSAEVEPVFRVLWVNASDYEQEARRALHDEVTKALASRPVYLGRPKVERFVTPR